MKYLINKFYSTKLLFALKYFCALNTGTFMDVLLSFITLDQVTVKNNPSSQNVTLSLVKCFCLSNLV